MFIYTINHHRNSPLIPLGFPESARSTETCCIDYIMTRLDSPACFTVSRRYVCYARSCWSSQAGWGGTGWGGAHGSRMTEARYCPGDCGTLPRRLSFTLKIFTNFHLKERIENSFICTTKFLVISYCITKYSAPLVLDVVGVSGTNKSAVPAPWPASRIASPSREFVCGCR